MIDEKHITNLQTEYEQFTVGENDLISIEFSDQGGKNHTTFKLTYTDGIKFIGLLGNFIIN